MTRNLHDRASTVFPDALKEAARDFLAAFKTHRGIGYEALRNLIMIEEDKAYDASVDKLSKSGTDETLPRDPKKLLNKDDIRHWLSGTKGQLGDNKFQYVDRFINKIDQSSLSPRLRAQIRSLNQEQTSFSLSRQFGQGAYSTEAQAALTARFEHAIFSDVLFEFYPPFHEAMTIDQLDYRATLWLIYTHSVDGSCIAADVIVGPLGRPAFDEELSPEDALAKIDHSTTEFQNIYSGSLVSVSADSRVSRASIDGFMLLKQTSLLKQPPNRSPNLILPSLAGTTFSFKSHEGVIAFPTKTMAMNRRPTFETTFPLLYDRASTGTPIVRPWSLRRYRLGFVNGIQAIDFPEARLSTHHPNIWRPLQRTPLLDAIGDKFAIGWME